MKNQIPCEVIQDLFPSYIDGLTRDVTNAEIKGHVEKCDSCRQVLAAMKNPDTEPVDYENKREIDFLKKTRKRTRKVMIGSILAAFFVVAAVLFAKMFLAGSYVNSDYLAYDLEVADNCLSIAGHTTSGTGIKEVEISDRDGIVEIRFKGVQKSFIYSSSFDKQYTTSGQIREIRIGKRIVWANREVISPAASAVYQTWHAYVGDMMANGSTVRALGLADDLGNFTNELQTKNEPYGWKMILSNRFSGNRQNEVEERMKSYAYVLLASIENLGEVTFEYQIDGKVCNLTLDVQDATAYAGTDIKQVGKDINEMERLMKKTGLNNMGNVRGDGW